MLWAQPRTPEELVAAVKARLDKVNDYEAKARMKTNVIFVKAPVATVKIYFKKPNKVRINNERGISFIPKGSVNINLATIFTEGLDSYDIVDAGMDAATHWRIIKLLPRREDAEIVLSTLYIDEAQALIRKARTTSRDNGTYELEMTYGKWLEFGLADKLIFSFNTKDYKVPKGITFDYDDGTRKESQQNPVKDKKGRVEIDYLDYQINKGVPDSVFQ